MPDTLGLPGFDDITVIGRGGFGIVYRARQLDFDRLVAVKVLPGAFDDRARSRFDRERRALGAMSSHPNIVQVHSSGLTDDGYPYLVMEFEPGGSLGDRMTRDGPLAWTEGAGVGAKLADALGAAHDRGVLHRDVKPENILFSAFGEPMLADFGIAQIVGQTATSTGIVTATLEHAAPEVLQGARPTQASDQYSLASTVYAAIAGRAPFVHDDDESFIPLITRTATEPPPDLRSQGVPDPVCAALERGLAKDPDQRYPSVRDLGVSLRAAVGEPPAHPAAPPPPAPTRSVTPTPPPPPASPAPPASSSPPGPPSPPDPTLPADASPPTGPGESDHGAATRRRVLAGVAAVVVLALVIGGIIAATSGGSSSGTPPVSGTLLLNDSLAQASSALQPSSTSSSTSRFTNGRLEITNTDPNGSIEILPTVHASGSQLASVSAGVDLYINNRQEAAGLSCRNQGDSARYAFLIDRDGSYGIFKNSATSSTELQNGSTNGSDHYRIQIECSGPAQAGGTVNLTFRVGSNSFSAQDQGGGLPAGRVAMEVDGNNTAQFANLSIAHH